MTKISDLHVGEAAKVVSFELAAAAYRQKLISLGLTPGTRFVVNRVAPLGDPIEITVRGFSLSLRKQEADIMTVQKVEV